MEERIIQALLEDAKDWLDENFDDIRQWSPALVDNERVVWVRCHDIPVHAWNNEFFSILAGKFRTFLGVDENTRNKTSMDVARILIRTRCYEVFNMVVYASINGSMYHIKVLEEWCGPMCWDGLTNPYESNEVGSNSESDEDSDEDDGPPLFTADHGFADNSGEEDGWLEGEGTQKLKNVDFNDNINLGNAENGIEVNDNNSMEHAENGIETSKTTHGEMEKEGDETLHAEIEIAAPSRGTRKERSAGCQSCGVQH